MDPGLIDAFDDAQRRGFALLREVVGLLQPGMSEVDIRELAEQRAQAQGFAGWFHSPEVQIGARIAKHSHWNRPSRNTSLKAGDLVSIDLGPADGDAYADVGTTHAFQHDEPKVVGVARECTRAVTGYASQWKTVGELFVYAKAWANNHRMELLSKRSIGHAALPKEGLLALDWPRSAHTATLLRRHQVHFFNPERVSGIWAIRPLVRDGDLAASFEEMIYVNGDERRILGRSGIEEAGTL